MKRKNRNETKQNKKIGRNHENYEGCWDRTEDSCDFGIDSQKL